MKQATLAMMNGLERYSKKTRRAAFLEEMEQVVPWSEARDGLADIPGRFASIGNVHINCATT